VAKDARHFLPYLRGTPRTPFNVAISGERILALCSLPLHEVKALAKAKGATVNDVVMAVCAGAIRRYLLERAALPDLPLVAAVPASVRPIGDATINNQVMFTLARLPTNVSAPLPRLVAASAAGREAKTLFADVKDLLTTDFSIPGAPLVISGIARLMAATRVANVLPWSFNVLISNVPGPRTPMYCVGSEAVHYYPLSVPFHGCALNITVLSYLDRLEFGLTACRKTVPDAQTLADYIGEDFHALCEAATALARPDAVAMIEIAPPRRLLTRETKPEDAAAKPHLTRVVSTDAAAPASRAKRASAKRTRPPTEANAEAEPGEDKANQPPTAATPAPAQVSAT
jgi:WS/DGAT/MGAT family acyltransferase